MAIAKQHRGCCFFVNKKSSKQAKNFKLRSAIGGSLMLMTIYVDYLIIDNMSFDCLLLWMAATTARQKVLWWRLLLVGVLGCLCAFVSIFLQGVLLVVVKLAFVVPMCAAVVGKRRLLVVVALFVAYTFVLGGAILGLLSLLDVRYQLQGGLSYYTKVPLGIVIGGVFVVILLMQWLVRYITKQRMVSRAIVKAKLCLPSATMQLDAFCDSGNMLFFNNLPVCFAVGSFAKHFGSILAEQLLCGNVSTIPFNTMSGEGRCLAIKCQLTVNQQKRWCYLALSNSHCSVDYQILLNGDFA